MKALWLMLLVGNVVSAASPTLTVYTYDSFVGPGTLGEFMAQESLRHTGCETKYRTFSTAGEALGQLQLEGASSSADLVVGVDQALLGSAQKSGKFLPWEKALTQELDPELLVDSSLEWLPFDYGYLALVYDDRRKDLPPSGMTLKEFSLNSKYRKRLVLEDPSTSSLGRSLLVWTQILYPPKEWEEYWKAMSQQTLTVAPGWTASYGAFLNGEADFVFSYTTSPAYHIEKENNSHIRALIFPEGNYRQVEMVGRTKASKHATCGERWVKRLLSATGQSEVPLRQWMYPAHRTVALPKSFQGLAKPKKVLSDLKKASELGRAEVKAWTRLWLGGK